MAYALGLSIISFSMVAVKKSEKKSNTMPIPIIKKKGIFKRFLAVVGRENFKDRDEKKNVQLIISTYNSGNEPTRSQFSGPTFRRLVPPFKEAILLAGNQQEFDVIAQRKKTVLENTIFAYLVEKEVMTEYEPPEGKTIGDVLSGEKNGIGEASVYNRRGGKGNGSKANIREYEMRRSVETWLVLNNISDDRWTELNQEAQIQECLHLVVDELEKSGEF